MTLLLFAAIGLVVGFRLAMSRAGYITVALTAVVFGVGQIVLLFLAKNRESMTMLPLVVGLILVLCMLLGALTRMALRCRSNA